MIRFATLLALLSLLLSASACAAEGETTNDTATTPVAELSDDQLPSNEREWREMLTPQACYILREGGTERPFTGKYWNSTDVGTYHCAGCGQALFRSDHKFQSGTGWPSYFQPIDGVDGSAISMKRDTSHGMIRVEVVCSRCDGHLGHVFNDGPEPTGLRYCINSAALTFVPDQATTTTSEAAEAAE